MKQKTPKKHNNLLSVFRIIESNNNYSAVGSSGEYGAYQFMPLMWIAFSTMFFGVVLDITEPANQDKVAKAKVLKLIAQGLTDTQIAAFWNSGKVHDWETLQGVNRFGVPFNVAEYVNRFLRIKNQT